MKSVIYNQSQLDAVYSDMCRILDEKQAISIDYSEYKKPKTKRQLGFIFGAIMNAVKEFYEDKGYTDWTDEAIRGEFYKAISPRIKLMNLTGKPYEHIKTISEMDRKEMSEFIDNCIQIIDRAECFKGLVLHPSVRNTWVNHLSTEDLMIDTTKWGRSCPEYLEHRRKQSCLICGRYGCEAHHIRESNSSGTGLKANDWETISLCRLCHSKYHTLGAKWFSKELWWILNNISLEDFVACQYNRWLAGFR